MPDGLGCCSLHGPVRPRYMKAGVRLSTLHDAPMTSQQCLRSGGMGLLSSRCGASPAAACIIIVHLCMESCKGTYEQGLDWHEAKQSTTVMRKQGLAAQSVGDCASPSCDVLARVHDGAPLWGIPQLYHNTALCSADTLTWQQWHASRLLVGHVLEEAEAKLGLQGFLPKHSGQPAGRISVSTCMGLWQVLALQAT